MSRNNFKHIEEEQNKHYPGAPPQIEKEVEHNLGLSRSMGNVLDMYFPKVIKIFLMFLGAKGDHIQQEHQTNEEDRNFDNPINRGSSASSVLPTDDPPPSGPSSPD